MKQRDLIKRLEKASFTNVEERLLQYIDNTYKIIHTNESRCQRLTQMLRTDFEHIGIYKKLAVEKCSKQSTDNNAYCK